MATAPDGVGPSPAEASSDRGLREAAKINELLGTAGYSPAVITKWWNSAAYEELDSQTPLRVWQRGDYEAVIRLVEALMQREFEKNSEAWESATPASTVLAGLRKRLDAAH